MNHAATNHHIMNKACPIEEDKQLKYGFLDDAINRNRFVDEEPVEGNEDDDEESTILNDDPDVLDEDDDDI